MSVEEVRVRRVDVARLHRHHIRPNLRCYRHGRLGEVHNYAVEKFHPAQDIDGTLTEIPTKSEDGPGITI